jgi:hypothetical protein
MFGIIEIVRYLTFITYFGFIVSSITGFVRISNNYDGQIMVISLYSLINIIFYSICVEGLKLPNFNNINNYYFKSYLIANISLLMLSVSDLGVGFGIWGFIMSIVNLFMGVFINDINTNNRRNIKINNDNITHDNNNNINIMNTHDEPENINSV